MSCSAHEELQLEWKWLVYHDPGTSHGVDTPAVRVVGLLTSKLGACEISEPRMRKGVPKSEAENAAVFSTFK